MINGFLKLLGGSKVYGVIAGAVVIAMLSGWLYVANLRSALDSANRDLLLEKSARMSAELALERLSAKQKQQIENIERLDRERAIALADLTPFTTRIDAINVCAPISQNAEDAINAPLVDSLNSINRDLNGVLERATRR